MEILSKSFSDCVEIKQGRPLGFFVIETEKLTFEYVLPKKKTKKNRMVVTRRRNSQTGGFMNCYDFASAGRYTVNQAAKISPDVMKNASNEIYNVAKQKIGQSISKGGS